MALNVCDQSPNWQAQQAVHATPEHHTDVLQEQQNAVQLGSLLQQACQPSSDHPHQDSNCNNYHCGTDDMMVPTYLNNRLEEYKQQTTCQQEKQMRQQSYKVPGRQTVPALNLSTVKFGKDVPVAVLPEITQETCEAVAIKDAELSLDDISPRQIQLHPDAPVHDRRCFVYQAVDTQVSPTHKSKLLTGALPLHQ